MSDQLSPEDEALAKQFLENAATMLARLVDGLNEADTLQLLKAVGRGGEFDLGVRPKKIPRITPGAGGSERRRIPDQGSGRPT